jgi:hypothetical protein
MSNRELAIQYLDGFSEGDINKIKNVLSDGFEFNGPFYSGKTAADYIKALASDPPDRSTYRILSIFERDDEMCIIYKFEKKGVAADIAQLFRFESDKISKSTLIFDSRQFA